MGSPDEAARIRRLERELADLRRDFDASRNATRSTGTGFARALLCRTTTVIAAASENVDGSYDLSHAPAQIWDTQLRTAASLWKMSQVKPATGTAPTIELANPWRDPLPTQTFVIAAQVTGGVWMPVSPPLRLTRFTLLASLAGGSAVGEIRDIDGVFTEDGVLEDPEGIFARLDEGDTGYAIRQDGRHIVIQAPCPNGGV